MIVKLGYSKTLSADDLLDLLDLDPEADKNGEFLIQNFGRDDIDPGSYEVYGREDFEDGVTDQELRELFAFELPQDLDWGVDLEDVSCFFYLQVEKDFQKTLENEIVYIATLQVEGFRY